MDYDFRNRAGPPYDSRASMYKPTTAPPASSHPMYGPSLYPRVGQAGHAVIPPVGRTSSYQQASSHHQTSPSPPSSSGLGIRIAIKPEYRITPPPQLLPQVGDIPRSTFQFDFEFERKILAEAEKGSHNWSRFGLENLPAKTTESTSSATSSAGSVSDPIASKYILAGLSQEAVVVAVANYGDNPSKVEEFVKGYNLLREMGFSSKNVGEALLMYDNDTDKALAYFLNNSS